MTTQAEVRKNAQVVQAPLKIKASVVFIVIGALLILALISTAIFVPASSGNEISTNARALDAWSARYQGMAELHAAGNAVGAQPARDAFLARYLDLTERYLAKAGLDQSWSATAARYQGLANPHGAAEEIGAQPAQDAFVARYLELTKRYLAGAGLDQSWSATAARYQGLAEYHQAGER